MLRKNIHAGNRNPSSDGNLGYIYSLCPRPRHRVVRDRAYSESDGFISIGRLVHYKDGFITVL